MAIASRAFLINQPLPIADSNILTSNFRPSFDYSHLFISCSFSKNGTLSLVTTHPTTGITTVEKLTENELEIGVRYNFETYVRSLGYEYNFRYSVTDGTIINLSVGESAEW